MSAKKSHSAAGGVLMAVALLVAFAPPLFFAPARASSREPAVAHMAAPDEALASQVQSISASGTEGANAWDGYVGTFRRGKFRSSSTRDPRNFTGQFLQDFISSYQKGERFDPIWKSLLDLSRSVPALTVAFKKYVLAKGIQRDAVGRVYKNSNFVQGFLSQMANGYMDAEDSGVVHRWLGNTATQLNKEAWEKYTASFGFKAQTPPLFPSSFLRDFIKSEGTWNSEHETALVRADELARKNPDQWNEFAQKHQSIVDPARYSRATLEEFISKVSANS